MDVAHLSNSGRERVLLRPKTGHLMVQNGRSELAAPAPQAAFRERGEWNDKVPIAVPTLRDCRIFCAPRALRESIEGGQADGDIGRAMWSECDWIKDPPIPLATPQKFLLKLYWYFKYIRVRIVALSGAPPSSDPAE